MPSRGHTMAHIWQIFALRILPTISQHLSTVSILQFHILPTANISHLTGTTAYRFCLFSLTRVINIATPQAQTLIQNDMEYASD